MGARIPTRLTDAQQGRAFGRTVGLAFAIIAALLWWRGNTTGFAVTGILAALLLLGALLAPTHLKPVERSWMRLAAILSRVTTPIMLSVVYFGVITPTALLRRALGKNALVRQPVGGSYWVPREPGKGRSDLTRQF